MEWLKKMPLKRALFTLTLMFLLAATILSVLAFTGCGYLCAALGPYSIYIVIPTDAPPVWVDAPAPSLWTTIAVFLLSALQIVLPVLFFVAAPLFTASLFYRWKLKEPLEVLTDGAEHIMKNDLDFTLTASSQDELGQLCNAFETMRRSLLFNNRQLWRQAEEQKRLNAAFSHDLRNPVTVLKGSAKLAKQAVTGGRTDSGALWEHVSRMEEYTDRIARYVETMSSVQRLEQLQPQKSAVGFKALSALLEQSLLFAAQDSGKRLLFSATDKTLTPSKTDRDAALTLSTADQDTTLMLDKSMLLQIAENLTANAFRFAGQTVMVELSLQADTLTLTVEDDGGGFGPEFLKNGIQPFHKGTEETGHFGMGLYICSLLCQKHGGTLRIGNGRTGTVSSATLFHIL